MGKFTVIPSSTFDGLQMDAGVLLKTFNPANPVSPADEDIICATTGGINPSCVASYSDLGEDVDNAPVNTMELKHLDSWECKLSFTSLGTDAATIRMALGAADINAETGAIIPRSDLDKDKDFSDLWWVGDRADGGCVAIQLKKALSTSGFSLQTTKSGKGQVSVELTGHVTLADQKTVPMVIYSLDPTEQAYTVTQSLSSVTSSFDGATVNDGESFNATLTPAENHAISAVTVTMGGVDITSTAYSADTHVITIGSVTGNLIITASADVITYSVTQNLTNVTSTYSDTTVESLASFTATLTAADSYTMGDVTVTMGGADITTTAYTADTGTISIDSVTGNLIITATASNE